MSISGRKVKVVLLAGSRDFGRCPIATRKPPALWPVLGEPVLQRVLRHLSGQNVDEVVICSGEDVSLLRRSVSIPYKIVVRFLSEELPLGTAGCIRQAAGRDSQSLWVVMRAAMVQPPDIDTLLRVHNEGETDLTLMLKSENERRAGNELADVYIIEPKAIEYIPTGGFYDIKEGLIPALAHAGRTVRAAQLSHAIGAFGGRSEYLAAVSGYLSSNGAGQMRTADRLNISGSAFIDPDARLYGPVMIMDDVTVQAGALVFGPAVIEKGVVIGANSFIENSAIWSGARVGQRCEIRNCIIDRRFVVADGSHLEDTAVTDADRNDEKLTEAFGSKTDTLVRKKEQQILHGKMGRAVHSRTKGFASAGAFCFLLAGLVWAYWPVLSGLWRVWRSSAEYSAGIIVPFLAGFILWARRKDISQAVVVPSMWGFIGFAFSQAVMIFGILYMYRTAERISFILAAASLVLLLFGWQVLRKTAPIFLFACLMLPLPQNVHDSVLVPAQRFSVSSAGFCLQSMGIFATSMGNTLQVGRSAMTIEAGCSGLRMVTAFMVVVAMTALLIRRTWWEKLLIVVSSIPIAMLCNTLRITVLAASTEVFAQGTRWYELLHNTAGFAMIPLALAGVVAELWLISKLAPVNGRLPVIHKMSLMWEST